MAYAKRYDINGNYKDSVRNRSGLVVLEFDSKLLVDQLLMCLKGTTNKNAREHIANMIVGAFMPFVPRQSGTLANAGLYVSTKGTTHAEIDIRYRNTSDVKYVLYQYYGIVYGPNYATWEQRKFDRADLKKSNSPAIHSGWVSPRGKGSKHPTSRKLGEPRSPYVFPDGRVIRYNGYTNPQSKARWLEYIRNTPEIWIPLTNNITNEIREMFDINWYKMTKSLPSLNVVKYMKYTRLNSPYARRYRKDYQKYIKKKGGRVNAG